jgi:6-pyruvoyl-tetrahydropterin synthase
MSVNGSTTSAQASHFQLTFRYRFEAAHRFTHSAAPSCMTPHGHTWFAEGIFTSDASGLGAEDMVVEFSQLKKSWKRFITETVDHSFLHHHADPILGALQEHIPGLRGLAFPGDPTTELVAALFFEKLRQMHAALKNAGGAVLAAGGHWPTLSEVVIQETPTNQIRYRAGAEPSAVVENLNRRFSGWWQTAEPADRSFVRRD